VSLVIETLRLVKTALDGSDPPPPHAMDVRTHAWNKNETRRTLTRMMLLLSEKRLH
jgi:hypothetical protein